ncbi:hypothetical protein H9P43_006196 [Blastocladiella emersonii ATCC 22665]|nr:hypothetical protein H9P43_006196 [Blastocladiella emersonii ATCC 22665]
MTVTLNSPDLSPAAVDLFASLAEHERAAGSHSPGAEKKKKGGFFKRISAIGFGRKRIDSHSTRDFDELLAKHGQDGLIAKAPKAPVAEEHLASVVASIVGNHEHPETLVSAVAYLGHLLQNDANLAVFVHSASFAGLAADLAARLDAVADAHTTALLATLLARIVLREPVTATNSVVKAGLHKAVLVYLQRHLADEDEALVPITVLAGAIFTFELDADAPNVFDGVNSADVAKLVQDLLRFHADASTADNLAKRKHALVLAAYLSASGAYRTRDLADQLAAFDVDVLDELIRGWSVIADQHVAYVALPALVLASDSLRVQAVEKGHLKALLSTPGAFDDAARGTSFLEFALSFPASVAVRDQIHDTPALAFAYTQLVESNTTAVAFLATFEPDRAKLTQALCAELSTIAALDASTESRVAPLFATLAQLATTSDTALFRHLVDQGNLVGITARVAAHATLGAQAACGAAMAAVVAAVPDRAGLLAVEVYGPALKKLNFDLDAVAAKSAAATQLVRTKMVARRVPTKEVQDAADALVPHVRAFFTGLSASVVAALAASDEGRALLSDLSAKSVGLVHAILTDENGDLIFNDNVGKATARYQAARGREEMSKLVDNDLFLDGVAGVLGKSFLPNIQALAIEVHGNLALYKDVFQSPDESIYEAFELMFDYCSTPTAVRHFINLHAALPVTDLDRILEGDEIIYAAAKSLDQASADLNTATILSYARSLAVRPAVPARTALATGSLLVRDPATALTINPALTSQHARAAFGATRSGKYAYTVTLSPGHTTNAPVLAWTTPDAALVPGHALGGDAHSYAVDLSSWLAVHSGTARNIKHPVRHGRVSVAACLLDLDAGTISVAVNGGAPIVVFRGIDAARTWFPTVTLAAHDAATHVSFTAPVAGADEYVPLARAASGLVDAHSVAAPALMPVADHAVAFERVKTRKQPKREPLKAPEHPVMGYFETAVVPGPLTGVGLRVEGTTVLYVFTRDAEFLVSVSTNTSTSGPRVDAASAAWTRDITSMVRHAIAGHLVDPVSTHAFVPSETDDERAVYGEFKPAHLAEGDEVPTDLVEVHFARVAPAAKEGTGARGGFVPAATEPVRVGFGVARVAEMQAEAFVRFGSGGVAPRDVCKFDLMVLNRGVAVPVVIGAAEVTAVAVADAELECPAFKATWVKPKDVMEERGCDDTLT